jgi:hypothetical protein
MVADIPREMETFVFLVLKLFGDLLISLTLAEREIIFFICYFLLKIHPVDYFVVSKSLMVLIYLHLLQ